MGLFSKKKKGASEEPEQDEQFKDLTDEEIKALEDQLNSQTGDGDFFFDAGEMTEVTDEELPEFPETLGETLEDADFFTDENGEPVPTVSMPDDDDEDEQEEKSEESAEQEKKELTPEEAFKAASAELCHRIRLLFPQQMIAGFYYGELSDGDYVDDFCSYVPGNELLERDDIPAKCGMSYPDMVSREDKLMSAFFKFRKAAEAHTQKACNGVSVTLLGNGQAKIDITTEVLTAEGEDERFAKFREIVVRSNPSNLPPAMTQEQTEELTKKTTEAYKALGTEFYSFLPETEFKKAYFYFELTKNGVFYYHRMVLEDGTILDGDDLYERYEMNKEEAEKNRLEIIRLIINVRQIFIASGQKPFSTVTLTVTQKGEFRSFMGFAEIEPEGEQERLDEWKNHFDGNEVME